MPNMAESESPEIFDDLYLGLRAGGAMRKKRRGEPLTTEEQEALGRWNRLSIGRKVVAVGAFTRKRVLKNGREYLNAQQVDAAFPGGEEGDPFDISHLAAAPDGTIALGVYRFPAKRPAQAAVELWRDGRLVSAFPVPPGSFVGGLGFAADGRLVATVLADSYTVRLFTRSGERRGSMPVTSW